MARYPGAVWRPLPENKTQPRLRKVTQVIAHTAVGEPSPWKYFGRDSVHEESTGWVGRDRVEQFMESDRHADANYLANSRAMSWESADNGHPDRDPWNDYQVEQFAQILAWANREHGVPIRACRSWDDPGFGYHRQFREWNPNNHSCPGDARIRQVPQIIARAREIAAGHDNPTPPQEDDMPLTDADIDRIADAVWARALRSGIDAAKGKYALPAGDLLARAASDALHGRAAAQQGVAAAGAITAAVEQATTGGVDIAAVQAAAQRGAADALQGITLHVDATSGD